MSLTKLVAVPSTINVGLTSARQSTMLSLLGNPRNDYDQTCREMTHPVLKTLVITQDVGPFHVRGLKPAVESLGRVMGDIEREVPRVFAALGTAGMLCVRNVRGSTTAISNHSWGTAIDLTIGGVLDVRGDGKVQQGLVDIFPIFNRHGWFWGAAFGTEDGMHFEISDGLIRRWASDGTLTGQKQRQPKKLLTLGDRGPEVTELQAKLNQLTGSRLKTDGEFGAGTLAAVIAFQGSVGLTPDGAVGKRTWEALGLD